jgi:nitrogen fixation/metabolism regulation signal transduction histidine kinase
MGVPDDPIMMIELAWFPRLTAQMQSVQDNGGSIMSPEILFLIAIAVILMLIAFVLGMVTGVSLSRPIIR